MSDKPAEKKKDDHGDAKEGEGKKSGGIMGLLTKLPVLLGGTMVIEAVVLVIVLKMLGGSPKQASAVELPPVPEAKAAEGAAKEGEAKSEGEHAAKPAEGEHGAAKEGEAAADSGDPKKSAELQLVEFRAPNKQSGRTYLYDVSIWVSVKGENKAAVAAGIKDNEALIKDRVRTIIAQLDPDKLGGGSEPGLETLRRQVKYQLENIIGDKMVDEVLVPRCIPFRTDF